MFSKLEKIEATRNAIPFPGFESGKIKPYPNRETALLIELIESGALGGDFALFCYEDCYSNKLQLMEKIKAGLFDFLPVLTGFSYFQDWKMHPYFSIWKKANEVYKSFPGGIFDPNYLSLKKEAVDRLTKSFELDPKTDPDLLNYLKGGLDPGQSLSQIYTGFLALANSFYCYNWKNTDSPIFEDFKMLHRLIYLLCCPGMIMPSKKEAKAIHDKKPTQIDYEIHFASPRFLEIFLDRKAYDAEKSFLLNWVNKKLEALPFVSFASIRNGFLSVTPISSVKHLNPSIFIEGMTATILNMVLKSFAPENISFGEFLRRKKKGSANPHSVYLSNGHLYIGVCHFCGGIIVKSNVKNRFCTKQKIGETEKKKRCRQNLNDLILKDQQRD